MFFTLEKFVRSTKTTGFINIMKFIFQKVKGYEVLKENLKKDFLKINKKLEKIAKLKKTLQIRDQKNIQNLSDSTKNLRYIGVLQLFSVVFKISTKNRYSVWCKLIICINLQEKTSLEEKNSILKSQNRCNGTIKHLSRSEEAVSLFSSHDYLTATKETPKTNKENSQISNSNYHPMEYNEEFISAINFLNNL